MVQVIALSTLGWVLVGIAFVCIRVALAFWPARVAARKGQQLPRVLHLQPVLFPAALIAAYLVGDRTGPAIA